ncbi:MAG: LCP family protein [bacterium]|nr:LCP family protein [bacterium]
MVRKISQRKPAKKEAPVDHNTAPLNTVVHHDVPATPAQPMKAKRRWPTRTLKISLYALVFVLILGFSLSYRVIFSSESIFGRQEAGFFDQIKHLVTSGDKQINGEDLDRVNILLVGMGGSGHQGAYLADTIIVASLKPSTKEVALLSIPRDFFVEIPGYRWGKINNANAFGYLEDPKKGGEKLLATTLEGILKQPIHYYASIDFSGFEEVVDLLGGVDIAVENSFTDYQFPDKNFGYDPVSFKAGQQMMDGETALKYVRSRHGNNGEGSDFARSRRQQRVLAAAKEKLLSFDTLINPKKVIEISDAVGAHFKTNMEVWEAVRLANLLKEADTSKIVNRVLDTSAGGLLVSDTTIDGAYIVTPRAGIDDYSEIRSLAKNIFSFTSLANEEATIEVQNGTRINGLADTTAQMLRQLSYNVVSVGNAEISESPETVIYDLTFGQKPDTLKQLSQTLAARVHSAQNVFSQNSTSPGPLDVSSNQLGFDEMPDNAAGNPTPIEPSADFLIILGTDAAGNLSADTPGLGV